MSATESSASDTGPFIPPATQIVPSIGLDGKPISTGGGSSVDNGGNEFPTAAIVIISIIGALVAFFIAYKLYVWTYGYWRHQRDDEDALPETRALAGGGGGASSPGAFATLPSQASFAPPIGAGSMAGRRSESGFGSYGRSRQASWGGESWGGFGEKGDLSPSYPYAGTPGPGSDISRGGSPTSDAARLTPSPFPNSSTRGSLAPSFPRRSYTSGSQPLLIHSRTASSFSSGQMLASGNRIAGAPHNPHSRIEVVPPAPLAPPPGAIVQTDKTTLDFAPSVGIGRNDNSETAEEWLNLANSSHHQQQQQETINPRYDGGNPYQSTSLPSPRHHAFPPSPQSGSAASSSSSSRGGPGIRGRPSLPHLRPSPATAGPGGSIPSNLSSPRDRSASTTGSSSRPSPNSSEGSLQHSNRAPPPPPPHVKVHSATNSLSISDESQGERSPLDKLQRRMEREARGLSLQGQAFDSTTTTTREQ
ncbi:uncharacterized protein JCM6883_006674 [Sporobolomyces salmoneus]|uniref:uncharacterized protein n=1 Tax=Sporobolomyces salmoneus TaxID=183962 RepID=UPI00316B3C22